ncbi:alpha/beta fold hydrolase [Robiginitalea aurantiaca]|uniref:Alpha/beta fold hydrolase n=1 Tax=Robiginitalea aurantiaca TaxID=3056915 RepID=A0ABT7WC62_9FLAO|nr:alpha/beta fold hydrolase [Robiginitalea aurantiaca]MDM9630507.1 alpha/beta fold hydrolase [Robiginitalea aurantiaca]
MELLHSNVLGQGDPLIVLHGFLGMSDNWKTLGKKYAANGYEVHLIDQRNHGRSFWSEDFDYSAMAADLLQYMDSKNLDRPIILGHSMGGKTAMHLACSNPDRVSKLLVADIAPREYPPHHEYILRALEALPLDQLKSRSEADEALSETIENWGIRQFLLKNLYWKAPGELGLRINLAVLKNKMKEIGEPLGEGFRYKGPTAFIRGGASDYVSDSDRLLILQHFPRAVVITLEGAGHWLHAEQPEAFLRESLNFMKS